MAEKKMARFTRRILSAGAIEKAFLLAKARFASVGVDAEKAVRQCLAIPVSLHCWQADDVAGLEGSATGGGGILATGHRPGAARTGDEMRQDFDLLLRLLPGAHRLNLHAIYAETGTKRVPRDRLAPQHFASWTAWAKARRIGLDFNPTCFAHPLASDGFTLSHPDASVRRFWIRHCAASRRIAAAFARTLKSPSCCNLWIPDGSKDVPADRWSPRERLARSLDAIYRAPAKGVIDTVESKLFGIGCESYTVGSHEFYLAYALRRRGLSLCFDLGHFHPTESVADKLSAVLPAMPQLLIHASRGVRWDSDHVVTASPELQAVCDEAALGGAMGRMLWALDFFDGSINRLAAYAVGARALRQALLRALLLPGALLRAAERAGDLSKRLALFEHRWELPFAAVWDYACLRARRPAGADWLAAVEAYEDKVLSKR